MRNLSIVVMALLFVCTAAWAQEKPNAINVFVTNPGGGWVSGDGAYWQGAFGASLQRMFTPRFSAEVAVSRERGYHRFTGRDPNTDIIFSRQIVSDTTPVDVAAHYHFLTSGSWKPYIGLDARFNEVEGRRAGVSGGVVWQFRPSLGLRLDGKLLGERNDRFDDAFKASVGLSWRF